MIIANGVRLRAAERTDIPSFVTWLNDPEVRHGLSLFLPLSQADEERWFESMLSSPLPEHPLVIEIETDTRWCAIGNCSFHEIDSRNRSAEVGIFIGAKDYWNRGYGTAVMRILLQHGFETLNLNRIMLRVFANNPGALRAYEKAGFIQEGRLRQAEYQDGGYLDVILMSVIREEWLQSGR